MSWVSAMMKRILAAPTTNDGARAPPGRGFLIVARADVQIGCRSRALGKLPFLVPSTTLASSEVPDRDQRFRDQRFRDQRFRQQPYAYAFIMDRLGMKLRPIVKP
jgi:hypothetical protein